MTITTYLNLDLVEIKDKIRIVDLFSLVLFIILDCQITTIYSFTK